MAFETRTVALSAIELADRTFRITTELSIDQLAMSLQAIGMIHCPLLAGETTRLVVVSGFRRVQAARRLGWETLTARVATAETQKLECARYAIAENAQQRRLNLVEVSRALNLLSEFFPDPEELAGSAAALGLAESPAAIRKILTISRLPDAIQALILDDTLSLSMALELQRIPAAESLIFAEIFRSLHLSLSKQREFFTMAGEIALREEKSCRAILEEVGLQQILCDENMSRVQKASAARFYLKQRRYPALSEARKNFAEFRNRLSLGKNFQLIPPADFEGSEYIIRLQFHNIAELRSHQAVLAALIENEEVRKMLD